MPCRTCSRAIDHGPLRSAAAAQRPSHPCRPAGPACSSPRRRACSVIPAPSARPCGPVDLDRKGRRGPGSGRPVRRSADALFASRASEEFAGQRSRRRCGAGLDLGSALRRSQDLLVMPGQAHPQARVTSRWRGSRPRTDTTHYPISRYQLQRRSQYTRNGATGY